MKELINTDLSSNSQQGLPALSPAVKAYIMCIWDEFGTNQNDYNQ